MSPRSTRRLLASLALLLSLAACETTAPATAPGVSAPAPVAAPATTFEAFLAEVKGEAVAKGIRAETVDRAFAGIRYNQDILAKETVQPEFVKPVWSYLDSAVSEERIATGRQLLIANRGLLEEVERSYGVQPQFIVAIWGLESNYGQFTGGFNVIEALATLAYGSERRRDFFREHLIEALRILDQGHIAAADMQGSWAGAMGQTQFMPLAFTERAIDFDRDGRRNIWTSLPDVFGSTANYLLSYGWDGSQSWGEEVRLPASFPWELTELDVKRPVVEWRALGVRRPNGTDLAPSTALASVIAPAGVHGPAFIVSENFDRILKYNASTNYALAIGHLADRIGGGGAFVQDWPRADQPLSRDERLELQTLLTARGYDTQGVDGIVGKNTRLAVRAFQREIGLPPDGYVNQVLLARLRALQVS
jgi:lytic murein transglycosylase